MKKTKKENELPSLSEKPQEEKHSVFSRILTVVNIVLLTCVVIAAIPVGVMLYRNTAYGDVFFINGMSMYPTLNKNSQTASGETKKWNSGTNSAKDLVDYGWGKASTNKDFFASLKRYDIVYTYFPSDYVDAPLYNTLSRNAELKIKRVVAFPNETIDLIYDPSEDETVFGNSVWGKTTITDASGDEMVLKNLYSEEDYPDITGVNGSVTKYTSLSFNSFPVHRSLGEDEYFVIGDNRRGNGSLDSRSSSVGPIKSKMIQGKACLITGMRELVLEDGELNAKFRFDHIRMPWDYINLEA